MTRVASLLNGGQLNRRLNTTAIWLCALLTAAHPLSSDGLWWELSKGRALVSGSWNPTADLIAGATGADASWLSGAIPYLLFSQLGLSGLMLLKLAVVFALTGLLLHRASRPDSIGSPRLIGATLAATLLSARQTWEPGAAIFDTLGLVSVYMATEQIANGKRRSEQLIAALLLLCLWANLGPCCIIGIPVVLSNFYRQPQKLLVGLGVSVVLLGACCLTPAGWRTLFDSLSTTVPQTIEQSEILRMSGWRPWWEDLARSETIAFIVLSVAYLLNIRRNPSVRCLFVLIAAYVLAGASSENLPIAAIWMALVATSGAIIPATSPAETRRSQSPSRKDASGASGPGETASSIGPVQLAWRTIACAAVLVWSLFSAVGPWDGCGCSLGWGVDPRLQPEAFAASLADVTIEGNAHCVGLREAGLLSWHEAQRMRPFDTPSTALLSRRLREHVLLTSDLSHRWQIPHRRLDGSWGGWWQVLRERGTVALVVPSENLTLIESLEPTVWKPLSLSAVSLVYGKAGDPDCTRQIVDTLSVRQIVDRGVWIYQPSSEESASTIEFFPGFGESCTAYRSLRLARVFRAMQMNVGSLKVLRAISNDAKTAARDEFHSNQLSLGYQERIRCGRSSELRLRSSLRAVPQKQFRLAVQEILNWSAVPDLPVDDGFSEAIQSYVAGDLTTALSSLPEDCPEALYAKALLLLESGEPRIAQTRLQEFLTTFPDHRLSAIARAFAASLAY